VRLFDLSAFSATTRPVPAASILETAKVQAGANITSMTAQRSSSFNRSVVVASRGDRVIEWIDVTESGLEISRKLRDSRADDPVVVDVNDRGPVVTVGDFDGKKLITFRVGPTEDNGGKPPANYGCGTGGADAMCATFECGGELALPGAVYFLGTTNVN
jgi:hypothetical protein